MKARYGVRVLVMVLQHTFGRRLNFNPHLHILVSADGLQESEGCWIAPLRFEKDALMCMWRYAVITYLREALKAKVLAAESSSEELTEVLTTQTNVDGTLTSITSSRSGSSYDMRAAIFAGYLMGDNQNSRPTTIRIPDQRQ